MKFLKIIVSRILIAGLIALSVGLVKAALAQGVPIGALPNATLPLGGSEYTILSQNGTTVKATVNAVVVPGITIPNNTVLGNVSGATTAAVSVTATQLKTMLGLGTAAYVDTGTGGHTLPFLDGNNTWTGLQTFSGGISLSTLTLGTLTVTGTTTLGSGTASPLVVTSTGVSANLASSAGTIELLPSNGTVNVTSTLHTSGAVTAGTSVSATTSVSSGTTVTAGTGLTVTTGGAAITGNSTISSGSFTASGGAFAASPANAAVTMSPTGTGVVTIAPATAGTLNNMVIGGSTPLAATFTTATANTAFRSTDFGSGSTSTVNFTTSGGTQLQITNTATAARNITITGSNAGNPTLSVTAGSLAITPATVFASTISATTVTNTGGEIFSGASAPITLNASVGTSGQVLTSAGAGATPTWTTVSAVYPTWAGAPKTTNFNATAGTAYCVDTQTTGAVTMTLPASPTDGDQIRFIDCKGYFQTVNMTVARNGKLIMGSATDMTVSTINAAATLTYSSTLGDWRMY